MQRYSLVLWGLTGCGLIVLVERTGPAELRQGGQQDCHRGDNTPSQCTEPVAVTPPAHDP